MRYLDIVRALFVSLVSASFAVAAPSVVAVSPASHTLTASRNSPVLITFDVAMDQATINSSTISIFGRWSGVASGTFQLENGNTRVRFTPTTLFFAGEWVTVSVSKGVRSLAGENLAKGYAWNFWVRTAPGTLNLTEIQRIPVRRSGEPHIQTYGAHGGDLNKDGYSDFFVPNEISADCRAFMNDRTGLYSTFTTYPISNGSRPSTNESADFNADGNLDIAVGNSTSDSVTVFLGNGTGGFLSIRNYLAAGGVRGLAVTDLDGDGDADIVTANRSGNNVAMLVNSGNGTFTSRTVMDAGTNGETACMTADANNDGILDLFVGSLNSSEISVLLGNGTGGFTFSSKQPAGGNGPWMVAVGDLNADGRVDVVSANSNAANCSVLFGNGLGGLSAATTYPTGSFPIAIDLGDVDGDGDLDLMTSNFSGANWTLYENNGVGVFINRRNFPSSQAGSCVTFHDRDNDGDLDMSGIDEQDDLIFLFRNGPATSIAAVPGVPQQFALHQNFPNPFNPETEIRFDVSAESNITLVVIDVLGRIVQTLVDERKTAGSTVVRWNGRDTNGSSVASGVYLCQLRAESTRDPVEIFNSSMKIIVLR